MSARRLATTALAVYTVVLLVVLFNPSAAIGSTSVDKVSALLFRLGAPETLARSRVEFVLNVALFVPWAYLASVVWRRPTWRDWTAYCFVATACVEVIQALVLSGRSGTFQDVAANTLGACLGALAASLVHRWRTRAGSS